MNSPNQPITSDFSTLVRRRRMVRAYTTEPVPHSVLAELVDLGSRAPSAGFSQGWDFIILTGPDCARFWNAGADPAQADDTWLRGMKTAPALILCLADPTRYLDRYAQPDKGWTDRSLDRWPIPYWDTDVAMAAMLILLGITERGLGGCFFGVPQERVSAVRDEFDVPASRRIVGVISVGHPDPEHQLRSASLKRGRRAREEFVHWGSFGRGDQCAEPGQTGQ